VGTLDVFLDRPHEWSEAEQGTLRRFSTVIEAALSSAITAHAAGEQAQQLQFALDHRITFERAVGFLMAREQVDAVTAFNRLRAAARDRRVKLSRVAQEVLDQG
jgi:AmiR/NasT family two-component response regulator